MTDYGPATEAQIKHVVDVCEKYGSTSIIALSGVPATGKSYVAAIAAQRHAEEPTRVREVQFHQSYTYEEFVEGLRITESGAVEPVEGVFLEWNNAAIEDGVLRYVLLIEELTRANIGAVLGELLTYVEHRERQFFSMFSRRSIRVANNLTIIATFNPVDRSAIDIDDALLRRLRIIEFSPSIAMLEEMLTRNGLPAHVIHKLKEIFNLCRANLPDLYDNMMPFGHGIFSDIFKEEDLYPLWQQRLRWILYRPLLDPNPFAATIKAGFPWSDKNFQLPAPETISAATPTGQAG